MLADPEEFSSYVMLGKGTTGEIVVSSSDKKHINCDVNVNYQPGVRLYLDVKKIACDGLLIRDGSHMKVKDEIDLDKYLLYAATAEIVNPHKDSWTPKEFAKEADTMFSTYIQSKKK